MVVSCSAYSSALKMAATCSPETSVGLHPFDRGTAWPSSPTDYTDVVCPVCPQLCTSALVLLLATAGAEDGKEKKQEKRGLLGLGYGALGGYGTLGGYGVGSGLTGYSGSGLAGLALPPVPAPLALPAPGPVLPPPPVFAPPHLIGASVHTTITKQVSTELLPCSLLVLIVCRSSLDCRSLSRT
jgi:hypothetical protein